MPILYSFRRCPYAMRTRLAIISSGIKVELREVVLKDKPEEMIELSPKGTVPVLLADDGTVLQESLDIMEWALEQADPAGLLAYDDEDTEDLAEDLIGINDGPFKHHLDKYKYGNGQEDTDPVFHREKALKFLEPLEELLTTNTYLVSDTISFADIAIFPFVRQFANVDRSWFDNLPMPQLKKWLSQWLLSESFLTAMEKQPQWKKGDAPTVFP